MWRIRTNTTPRPNSTTKVLHTTGKILDTATKILDAVGKALPGKDARCHVHDFTRRGEDVARRETRMSVGVWRILLVVAYVKSRLLWWVCTRGLP